jgi:hypothetical protein
MNEPLPLFNRKAIRPVECLSEGWELVKGNYWLFMGISVVGYIIANLAPLAILWGPMMCGMYYCFRQQQRRREVKFEMLFKGFDYFLQSLIASALMFIPLIVFFLLAYAALIALFLAAAPSGGGPGKSSAPWVMLGGMGVFYSVLLLVVVVFQVLFFFVYPLIVDRKMKGVEAFRTSFRAATANLGGVTGIVLLIMLLDIVGSFACCIGQFFVMPVHFAAMAVAYRKVFPEEGMAPLPPVEGPEGDYGPVPGTDEG